MHVCELMLHCLHMTVHGRSTDTYSMYIKHGCTVWPMHDPKLQVMQAAYNSILWF